MELHRAIQQIGRGVFGFDVLQLIAGANATADKAVAAHVLAVNQSLDQALVQRVADLLEIGLDEGVIIPAEEPADAEPAILRSVLPDQQAVLLPTDGSRSCSATLQRRRS